MQHVKWKLPHDIRVLIAQMAHNLWLQKWNQRWKRRFSSGRRREVSIEQHIAQFALQRLNVKWSNIIQHHNFHKVIFKTPSPSEVEDYLHRLVRPDQRMRYLNCDANQIQLCEERMYYKTLYHEYEEFLTGFSSARNFLRPR